MEWRSAQNKELGRQRWPTSFSSTAVFLYHLHSMVSSCSFVRGLKNVLRTMVPLMPNLVLLTLHVDFSCLLQLRNHRTR